MIAQDKAQVQATKTCAECPFFDPNQGRHGWCGVFGQGAKPHHKSTEICAQEVTRLQSKAPTHVDEAEYELGRTHGQRDAGDRLPPMYEAARDAYAAGYLAGYESILNPVPMPELVKSVSWSIQYDPKWDWYRVWVGDRCVGHASTHDEAERMAQRYIATGETIQRQNAAVMAGYGD